MKWVTCIMQFGLNKSLHVYNKWCVQPILTKKLQIQKQIRIGHGQQKTDVFYLC